MLELQERSTAHKLEQRIQHNLKNKNPHKTLTCLYSLLLIFLPVNKL